MSNSKSKKILSLLLTLLMVLSIIPMGVLSASAAGSNDYTLFIDGMIATKNNKDGADVTLSALGITPSGNATDGYVYEFNNVNFETTAATAIKFNNDATINLVGENTIKGGNSTDEDSNGIYAKNLTIQGEGSLTVVVGSTTKAYSNGIKCAGHSLTINGGNLTVTAGNSDIASIGIYCNSFKMTKGNVEVKSGNAEYCYGIWVTSTCILVEGGALNCTSGTASSGKSVAVYAYGGEANARVVDPDSGAVLSYDPTSHCYKKDANIATKATLTVKTEEYTLVLDKTNGYKNEVTETNKFTVDELTALGITASGTAESGFVYEFNNVNFETSAAAAILFNNDATINLVGENTVKGGDSTVIDTFGIYTEYNLTIQGEGKIAVVSGNGIGFSVGLECASLNINGGNLIIIGGNSDSMSYGVCCRTFKMTKGNVEATAGNAAYCYGNCVNSTNFLVEGGTLNCTSGTGSVISAAVYADGEANAKVVDPDGGAVLSYDPNSYCYKKDSNYATKATITAKPVDYKLYVDGLTAKKNDKNGDVVDLSTLGITPSGTAESGYVYEFNNVNFETTNNRAINFEKDATINLVGENTVKSGNCPGKSTGGIDAKNLTIQGEGSLSVVAGNTDRAIEGISCSTLSINGGKINVTAGNSTGGQIIGVDCSYFKMTNGEAEIKSGYSITNTCCMSVSKEFLMEGGSLNCVAVNNATTGNVSCIGVAVGFPGATFKVIGGTVTASCDKGTGTGIYGAVCSYFSEADAKVVDTDTKAILTRDGTDGLYKNNTTIATKATLTAMLCEYNSTKYVSIAKALEAIGTGTEAEHATGTIKLLDNVKENVVIGEFQEIILDLNGYKLENDKLDYTISNNGKLSVIDLSTDKTGEIFSNYTTINNDTTGDLTVTDIKIKSKTPTDIIAHGIENYGTCLIQGNKTEITAISNDVAFCISNYGTISINAGKFTVFGSGIRCAAFYTANDKVTIGKDAEFILGKSTSTYNCAYMLYEDYTISSGKFSGPIGTLGTPKVTVTGGSFTENPKDMVNNDTHKVVDNGNTVAYRYTVEEKIDTTISAPTTISKMYDGSALNGAASTAVTTGTTLTYQTKDAADGQYSDESNNVPSLTDAGTLYVKAIARHADYKTVSVEYVLTVSTRDITFTSGSANKTVDGSPLTSSQITVSGDGFAGEEGATYDVIGSQTEIGSSDNSFVVNWNNNTKEANYNVTKVYGTLTVYQDKMKVFAEKKAEALSRLDILDEEFGTVISYRLIKNSKSEIGNMNYDESITLDENIAAIEAIYKSVEETVMRRHHFIYSCPFMTFMAQFLQPIFRYLVQLF